MANDYTVNYNDISIAVGMKIGRIISRQNAEGNSYFELVLGSIKSIRLGKRKNTVEIDKFYPQDLEYLMTDIVIHQIFLSKGIMKINTFFVADDDTIKHVEKWIEWAKNKSEKDLSLLSSLEMDESEETNNA